MDKLQENEPRDTGYSVDQSIHVQGENEQEEEDLEDRRRREAEKFKKQKMDKSPQGPVLSVEEELLCKEGGNEQEEEDLVDRQRREAELHNIISTRLGNISYDDDPSINSTSFDSTSTSRYQSNLVEGDAYKDASLNSFEQLQVMYEARVNEQKELRKTIDDMKVQHKTDSDEITRKMYLLEADFNRVQFLYEQVQEVLDEKNLEMKQKEMRLAELTQIVTDLTASRNELRDELSSWKETHAALEQKLQLMEKGLTKKASEKEIRGHYEQQLSKLQESIRVNTGKYESAKTEIILLKERVNDFDENEKQLIYLRNLNKKSHVCVECSEFFREICILESNMGITKEVEPVKLTPGEALTHDQNEAILKQYISTLRQLMNIFPKPGEVDELQAEVASLAQTVVLLKKQFGEKKPDAHIQLLLEQKDLDICDLKEIIVKLQVEKEIVDNDMKEAILALNRKENKLAELTDSLAQLTHDEKKFKSEVFEQEKIRGEVNRTVGQEMDSLDPMINQIFTLTEHLQKQVAQLKITASIECVEKLSDIYIITTQLKETEKAFKNNLDLKMSGEDVGFKQIEAFAQKVLSVNHHRTDLEQDLIEHLATYIESNNRKDDIAREILEELQNLSKDNTNLQDKLALKLQENVQMQLDKDEEILQLQKKLDKITLGQQSTDKHESQIINEKNKKIRLLQKQIDIITKEQIVAQKTIIARDEKLTNLLAHADFRMTPMKTVPKSAKKSLPEAKKPVPEARILLPEAKKPTKSKTQKQIDSDEELREVNEAIAKRDVELANLPKLIRLSESIKKSISSLPESPTNKTDTPKAAAAANKNQKVGSATKKYQIPDAAEEQTYSDYESNEEEPLNTKENDLGYTDLLRLYNEYGQKFVLQEKLVAKLKNKITALKVKLKEFEKVKINLRRIEHFEHENLRLQEQNANLNSDLTAAQMQIIELSEKIEKFESQGELIEDMKKKSHIFQEYMNEQIALRLTQSPANSVAVTNTATNTSDSFNVTKQAQRLEVFNNILERKNDQYRILLEENKCLKEKISFDRSALNDLTAMWNNEIDRLKTFAYTTTKNNLELVEQVKVLSNNLITCQQLFQSVSSKLACANEIISQFSETLEEPRPDFNQLKDAMANFLIRLKNQIGNCLENNRP